MCSNKYKILQVFTKIQQKMNKKKYFIYFNPVEFSTHVQIGYGQKDLDVAVDMDISKYIRLLHNSMILP